MRDVELFLKMLAEQVYTARVGGLPLRDATDFKAWLHQCSRIAANSQTMEGFFKDLKELTPV